MKNKRKIERVKRVKILRSQFPTYWYNECIGLTFLVKNESSEDWRVYDNGKKSLYLINKKDARIIHKKVAKGKQ